MDGLTQYMHVASLDTYRGGSGKVSIHGQSMHGHSFCGIHEYLDS